ncbi:MAG TPA: 3-oxoacyl-ACP reductase FabG [Conexibacter sp.]|nr:3-oxoacyl-ACP reductase FabG [Conexibacter sp.]
MPPDRGCALVTGSSRGIGAATARALAHAGWPVVVNYRADAGGAERVVAEVEAAGGAALPGPADVTSADDVERLFRLAEERFGHVAVLVNNAGVRADGLTVQLREDAWQRVLETNLTAAFRTCRRALMPMVRARFGRIVNVASVVGPRIGNPGQPNYAAAKAGLVGFTRSVAREVAHRGVTANAIAPGFVQTELTADVDPGFVQAVPARRAGTPAEIAACVRFLASEEAAYVTGALLAVDGGLTA